MVVRKCLVLAVTVAAAATYFITYPAVAYADATTPSVWASTLASTTKMPTP